MSDVIHLHLNDRQMMVDSSSLGRDAKMTINEATMGGPKRTKIVFKDHDTGKILGEYENKVVIPGSQFAAMKMFDLDKTVVFPSYNTDMALDNSKPDTDTPTSIPKVCLFGVSDSGCGTEPKDIHVVKVTDRIKPGPKVISDPANPSTSFDSDMLMPFRFVDIGDDLSPNLRKYYFGRKTFNEINKVGYYFKKFDTDPQLHLRYSDGTQITEDNIWSIDTDLLAECYVEMRLRITRLDFRDYFEEILGWNNARISALSLCTAWQEEGTDGYYYYQDILPYTLLNFSFRPLADTSVAIDIIYSIYY